MKKSEEKACKSLFITKVVLLTESIHYIFNFRHAIIKKEPFTGKPNTWTMIA